MKALPVGISDFKRIREEGMYYIDKTRLISEFFRSSMFMTLYTRPRQFGKSLNLSMFHSFLEIGEDPSLFEGLKIMEDTEVVQKHMGKYPVVHLSFKMVNHDTFSESRRKLCGVLGAEFVRFSFLLESPRLNPLQKDLFSLVLNTKKGGQEEYFRMSDDFLTSGLALLTELLHTHYGKRCVVLIDEYDVPLEMAYVHNYYPKMLPLVKGMMHEALKDNPHVAYGIVTGCLRISKGGLFTDVNNFRVNSVVSRVMDEYFGFTEREVGIILREYGLGDYAERFRARYDGYRFGAESIYNPWDVMAAVADSVGSLLEGGLPVLKNYWKSAGENLNLSRLLNESGNFFLKSALLKLVDGGEVAFTINEDLRYSDVYAGGSKPCFANFLTMMLMTGFVTLTEDTPPDTRDVKVRIPNQEVKDLLEDKIMDWKSRIRCRP